MRVATHWVPDAAELMFGIVGTPCCQMPAALAQSPMPDSKSSSYGFVGVTTTVLVATQLTWMS